MISNKYFVVIIKENEASVAYVSDKKIIHYMEGSFYSQKDNIDKIFSLNKRARIIIILDNKNHIYEKNRINSSSITKAEYIMKAKLKNEYSELTFKGATKLLENKKLNAYDHMFITIHKNEEINLWLDYIANLNNRIDAVYSFALEIKGLINTLVKKEKQTEWQILINEAEYFMYHREELVSRGDVADNFEELLANSGEPLSIYVIGDTKVNFNSTENIFHFSYKQLNTLLTTENYCNLDHMIALTSNYHKRNYKLYNPDISPMILIGKLYHYLNILLLGGSAIIILIFLVLWTAFNELEEKQQYIDETKTAKEFNLQQLNDELKALEIQDVIDAPKVSFESIPMQFIAKTMLLKQKNILIKELNWESLSDTIKYTITIDLLFENKADPKAEIDLLINKVKFNFQDSDVSYISSNNQNELKALITISVIQKQKIGS